MKKYLITAVITSIVMLGAMGTVAFMLSKNQASNQEAVVEKQQEELDLLNPDTPKESINGNDVVTLYRAGDQKNVETFVYKNNQAVYNVKRSNQVKEQLDRMKRKQDYSFDTPLWAYNPFGTNALSMYVYFETAEPTYIKYTISVDDDAIPDFTRTLYNGKANHVTTEHEYQLIGLVPGMENYIVLKIYNQNEQMTKKIVYKLDLSDIKMDVSTKIATTTGTSKSQLTNGLYYLFGMNGSGNSKEKVIYLYDNSGILRGAIPLENYQSDRIQMIDEGMFYGYGLSKFATVNALGQVIKLYSIGKYQQHHDYTYDGFGHMLVLATDPTKKTSTIQDVVVSMDLSTGKTTKILDFEKLLPKIKKAAKKTSGSSKLNWIRLNSITMVGSNDIIVSAGEFSTIMRVNQVNSKKPTIQYMVAESALIKGTGYKKLLLKKSVVTGENKFLAQIGQSAVAYEADSGLSEGQYYLYVFNNNYGTSPTRPTFDWSQFTGIGSKTHTADNSLCYKYLVDETASTYELIKQIKVPYSSTLGSIQEYKTNQVINSGKAAIFGEYDSTGKLIREYKADTAADIKRVYKYDMKGFWFQ